jgi:methyl-accepting chemotaxis protein
MALSTGNLKLKIFLLNLIIPLGVGAFRQIIITVFNPSLAVSFTERVLKAFQLPVFGAILIFSFILFGLILNSLSPLFRYLKRGEQYDRARKAALSIPWYLLGLHMGLWFIGTTAVYAFVYNWQAPGGVSYAWSVVLAVGSGLITGLYTALAMNTILLPAKRELKMTDIKQGERDRFITMKSSLILLSGMGAASLFLIYAAVFYIEAEVIPDLLGNPIPALGVLAFIFILVYWRMSALSQKEYRFQVSLLQTKIQSLAESGGDLTQRIHLVNFDEVGEITYLFNSFIASLGEIVSHVKHSAEDLASAGKSLSTHMEDTISSVEGITNTLKNMGNQVVDQVGKISESSAAVEEITQNIDSLDSMITSQSAAVTQSSSAVEEMIANIRSVTRNIEELGDFIDQLVGAANQGRDKLTYVSNEINAVAEQSQSLEEANKLIANIAARTNLLAMNAAIEAAHAGSAGKGFAVVADEIRNLAENSSSQSKVINQELKSTREVISRVVSASEEAEAAFSTVQQRIDRVNKLQDEIGAAMQEQSQGSEEVLKALSKINDITGEVKSGADEMKEGGKATLEDLTSFMELNDKVKKCVQDISSGAEEIKTIVERVSEVVQQNKAEIDLLRGRTDYFTI